MLPGVGAGNGSLDQLPETGARLVGFDGLVGVTPKFMVYDRVC